MGYGPRRHVGKQGMRRAAFALLGLFWIVGGPVASAAERPTIADTLPLAATPYPGGHITSRFDVPGARAKVTYTVQASVRDLIAYYVRQTARAHLVPLGSVDPISTDFAIIFFARPGSIGMFQVAISKAGTASKVTVDDIIRMNSRSSQQ